MSEASLLQTLRTAAEAKRILESDFDFLTLSSFSKPSLCRLQDGVDCELIATDASGGEFALCDARSLPERPLLYASSEGQAGIIARSLERGLSVIIDLPFWQDCLQFSGRGQLVEMRRVVPLAETDLVAQSPNIASSRHTLRTLLGVSPVPDPVEELHSAVVRLSPYYPVCSADDWQFESLFGKFTVVQNGEWRRRLNLPT